MIARLGDLESDPLAGDRVRGHQTNQRVRARPVGQEPDRLALIETRGSGRRRRIRGCRPFDEHRLARDQVRQDLCLDLGWCCDAGTLNYLNEFFAF